MRAVSEAVILLAGSGSRLRTADERFLKPLVPILGRPLIYYAFDALLEVGVENITAITGYASERMTVAVRELAPPDLELRFVHNPDWQKKNGISVLAAAAHVTAPFILMVGDHLFAPGIIDRFLRATARDCTSLAIDRKLDSIFDLNDAMKVQTRGDGIAEIGKGLPKYDAIDTGLFICRESIFDYLERAKKNEDCSLADGIRLMAKNDQVRVFDIGDAWWQDVDTPEMLEHAETLLASANAVSARNR
jgi:choline kinase